MAGRKQHFIPRHFLKEFVVPDGSDKLWMYRRGLPKPVPVSRDDAAATRDFYSKPAETDAPTLDDLITDYENELKFHVEKVRSIGSGEGVPPHPISEIIAHLSLRAAYLREFIDLGAVELVSSIDTLIHDPKEILKGIELPRHRVPYKFEALAIEQLEEHMLSVLTNLTSKAVVRLLYHAIREDIDLVQHRASDEFSTFLNGFQTQLEGMGRRAHVNVLEKELVPAPRKTLLESFEWKVVDFPSGDAILADCVAIAEDAEGWGPYMLADSKSLTRVVIPLSSSKLAIGGDSLKLDNVVEIYNETARACCFTFYLANCKKDVSFGHLAELGGMAREKISKLTSTSVRDAVEEFVTDVPRNTQQETLPVTWNDLIKNAECSYSVSFRDFGDEDYAKRVAASLNEVVKSFASFLPVHRLDGISFAEDYAAALQELDRGEGVTRTIDASAGMNPNGVAMPLAVRRDDGIKTHIVLRGYIAEYLICEDEELKDEAVSVVCYSLGTAAFNALIEGKFPETVLSPHADAYEGWLYQYNDALLATYFSTRLLSPSWDTLEFYAEQAREQLERMIVETMKAQSRYQESGDHECYFESCATHVSGFMSAMARFLAVRASVIGPHRKETALDQYLTQLELSKWSNLFHKDLAAFNHGLDVWTNLDDIYFINRHFERLLFEVGVFPDQLNDGSLYIHTSGEHRLSLKLDACQKMVSCSKI